jgi:ankyrin repeat protein
MACLLDHGAAINATDDTGASPLIYAVLSSSKQAINLLVVRGADTHVRNFDGNTALTFALKHEDNALVKLLIRKGANVRNCDNAGTPDLMAASTQRIESTVFTESISALLDAGADINARDHAGRTLLMVEAESGSYWMVDLLIRRHAELNLRTPTGDTALRLAQRCLQEFRSGNTECCIGNADDIAKTIRLLKRADAKE